MGVSIHYRGRLNDVGQVARLREELADIAAAMGWKSTQLDDDWEQPADARLRFTPTGARIDGSLGLKGILLTPEGGAESLSFFCDREGNLRSLMDMVSDEGEYWETGDIRVLRQKMELIGAQIEQLSRKLSSARFGDVSGLSAEEIASRIEQALLGDHAQSSGETTDDVA